MYQCKVVGYLTPLYCSYSKELKRLIEKEFKTTVNELPTVHWWIFMFLKNKVNNVDILVGACALTKVNTPNIYISHLCVHGDHRRQGIGTTMLKKSVDYFNHWIYDHLFWDVENHNVNAMKMYQKFGAIMSAVSREPDITEFYIKLEQKEN